MIERMPHAPPEVEETPRLNAARSEFTEVYYDALRWQREGEELEARSALILLAQMILVAVDRESLDRLTRHLRHFLENEAVRRDFFRSAGIDQDAEWEDVCLEAR